MYYLRYKYKYVLAVFVPTLSIVSGETVLLSARSVQSQNELLGYVSIPAAVRKVPFRK